MTVPRIPSASSSKRLPDRQRRQKPDDIATHTAGQQDDALLRGFRGDGFGQVGVGTIRIVVRDDLDRTHGARDSNITDAAGIGLHLLRPVLDLLTDRLCLVAEFFFLDDIEDRESCCTTQWRSGIGSTEAAGFDRVHDVGLADNTRQREAAREALGNRHEIGFDTGMLDSKQFARATEACLNFVDNQDDAVLVANFSQRFDKRGRRRVKTALALHGLDNHGGDARRFDVRLEQLVECRQRVLHGDTVIIDRIRNVKHLGRERSETDLVRHHFPVSAMPIIVRP